MKLGSMLVGICLFAPTLANAGALISARTARSLVRTVAKNDKALPPGIRGHIDFYRKGGKTIYVLHGSSLDATTKEMGHPNLFNYPVTGNIDLAKNSAKGGLARVSEPSLLYQIDVSGWKKLNLK